MAQQVFVLRKSPSTLLECRRPLRMDVIDADRNFVVASARFDLDLDEVERFLAE